MKKILVIALILLTACVFLSTISFADEAVSSNIEGPEILRVEETLTIHYVVDNIQSSGFQGMISYDKTQMLLIDAYAYDSAWNVEVLTNGLFLAYSKTPTDESSFFNGGQLFSLTFSLKNNVNPEDILNVEVLGVFAVVSSADGIDSEVSIPDAEYTKKVDPPASANADLSALSISGISFSPAFSPEITEYKVSLGVEYSVTSLDIIPTPAHHRARYEISGNDLKVGNNTVTVTVYAENGEKKDYIINVKRAHDPAQPLSNDTRLSELSVSLGSLSPAFSPEVKDYVLYLPYGTEILQIVATPFSEFAQEIEPITCDLNEGNNIIKITCISEDSSRGEYTINAYVMPKYSGFVPSVTNGIPLEGTPNVHGTLSVGNELFAELTGAPEGSYKVEWYKNGVKVSESERFTVLKEDIGCVIYARFVALGDYYGSFECPRMTITKDGDLVMTDSYVQKNTGSITVGVLIISTIFCAALFLATGLAVGLKKKNLLLKK